MISRLGFILAVVTLSGCSQSKRSANDGAPNTSPSTNKGADKIVPSDWPTSSVTGIEPVSVVDNATCLEIQKAIPKEWVFESHRNVIRLRRASVQSQDSDVVLFFYKRLSQEAWKSSPLPRAGHYNDNYTVQITCFGHLAPHESPVGDKEADHVVDNISGRLDLIRYHARR